MELKLINNSELLGKQVSVYGDIANPLFLAKDVAEWLELTNVSDMISRIDDDEVTKLNLGSRQGETWFLTENGVYEVLMQSRKALAKQFKKGVKQILCSIRKHGMYATEDVIDKAIQDPDFIIKVMTSLKEERQQRQLAESKATLFEQVTIEQAPKVIFADAVATSKRSCLIAELAKLLQQNGVNIGQNRLFEWLRGNDYLCRKGEYYNQPTQRAMQLGLFEIKKNAIPKPDGVVLTSTTTKVTGKGQIYFINKFCRQSQLI